MSVLTYCNVWSSYYKEPGEVLAADKARKLHEKRKPYSVIVESEGGWKVVEMCFYQVYCHVLFLDERKRIATRYSFVETVGERLFLAEAAVHDYPGEGDRSNRRELYKFEENGAVTHDVRESGGPITRREGTADVSRNYSAVPEFGRYESVLVWDR